ncbi:uncharacterized protein LOC141682726 [Apium graveolens]|uniref:uncharacterized protein LOC141682726 n=1 Tax=Apium graveolens TaxID=4045 RepID=UPI003D78DE15
MAMSLPEAIIFYEISSRLCVKYLIRLSIVCKRWFSLIMKPGPINSFLARTSFNLQHNTTCHTSLVTESIFAHCPPITVLHNITDSSFSKCINLINGQSNISTSCYLVDSVHGLVCFSYASREEGLLFLWNPVTNLFKTVPVPHLSSTVFADNYHIVHSEFALGYDPVNADIKILNIELWESRYKEPRSSLQIHLYSCKTETWKEIKDETATPQMFIFVQNMKSSPNYAYVNFYERPATLVAFDFHDEVFKHLPSWETFLTEVACNPCLIDRVSTAVYSSKWGSQVVIALDEIQGIWSQQYILPDLLKYRYNLQLSFRNGDIIVDDRNGNLLLFQAESCQFKNLINLGPTWTYRHVLPYTESLIYIKGMQKLNRENVNKCFNNRELKEGKKPIMKRNRRQNLVERKQKIKAQKN